MRIGDAREFFSKLGLEAMEQIQERFAEIEEPLGPGSKFRFTCDADGKCCTNRDNQPIILTSYDVLRLRKRLAIKSDEFLRKYANVILGAESRLPMAIVKTKPNDKYQRCTFLNVTACGVHEDKPLRCRLYPLGRAIDPNEGRSYFFTQKVPAHCQLGRGREWTLEEYLKESEIEVYADWSDKLIEPLMKMDHNKYKGLALSHKYTLASVMYDFDFWADKGVREGMLNYPIGDETYMELMQDGVRVFVESFVGYRTENKPVIT